MTTRVPNPFDQPSQRPPAEEVEKFMSEKAPEPDESIPFPESAISGSLGELAHELAEGTEIPLEFYFASLLTLIGALCATRLHLAVNCECEPRLFTVLLGASADAKKSTALRRAAKTLLPVLADAVKILHGIGSAEGLARTLVKANHVLLCYDELKSLFDKCRIEGSTLLAMVASFFENNRWSNPTKDPKQSIEVTDGHLSLLACCTTDTYTNMWSAEAISIGLPNRLFVVSSDRKRKIAWPKEPDAAALDRIVKRIKSQLDSLPRTFSITTEAKARWTQWYEALDRSVHTKRLDALGFRLMQLLALTNARLVIDLQTIDATLAILDYELMVRRLTDPIDCENLIARLEEKIRRTLRARGPLNHRQLLQFTNANRSGLWAFEQATGNLKHHEQIRLDSLHLYSLTPEGSE